jgi:hypothetical protein
MSMSLDPKCSNLLSKAAKLAAAAEEGDGEGVSSGCAGGVMVLL